MQYLTVQNYFIDKLPLTKKIHYMNVFLKRHVIALLTGLLVLGCTKSSWKTAGDSNKTTSLTGDARRGEVLFLGNASKHHDSGKYAPWLSIKLFQTGINTSYTENLDDLNPANLAKYDALIIYANHDVVSPAQENALKDFVEGGKGLIPLHSASGCFLNSEWYLSTVGGQFASHKTGDFTGEIVEANHPVMKGLKPFTTWDETYVLKGINPDMTVLTERVEDGNHYPYTWVRTQGKGRVFYTAYGHEDRTWANDGFLDLVSNGVHWALGDEVNARIAALKIPDVSIYDLDTMAAYTKRHLVPKMQEALTPAESNKLTQVLPDFRIELFASDPDIENPIAMAWDERGRLWVVESVDYPNTFKETDGEANDRIKICEDTNGDGKADKFTVFADGLNIPTSMVFANDGVIVSMAPDILFMQDTNGDDVADVREIISHGWRKGDTHSGPSNLSYGFDNKIWGTVGYSGFEGTMNDKKMRFSQGVYHFKPDGDDFAYLGRTSNNTWGLGLTEDNNAFISTANNTHSAYYSMPENYLTRAVPGDDRQVDAVQKIDGHYAAHTMTPNIRQVDVVGGYTAAAGHHFYTARDYPKEYWNRVAFVSEPSMRLVHNAIIEPDGAGFIEKDGWNLLASSDEWFGPVQAQVGPDGAVWISDWYNFIIQHNVFVPRQAPSEYVLPFVEQPQGQGNAFISPLRDVNHGRVYRVVYKNAAQKPAMKLSKNDIPGMVAALEDDNMFWRMTAQRLLVELQDRSVVAELYRIVSDKKVDEIGLNSPAVHALWTLHGLGLLDGSDKTAIGMARAALSHPAAGVRKAAAQVLPKDEASFGSINDMLKDPNLNTRLANIVEMVELPASDEVGEAIYLASLEDENAKDRWLSKALLSAAITHQKGFMAAAKKYDRKSEFKDKIAAMLAKEVYELNRRSAMQYPPEVKGKEITIRTTVTKADDKPLEGFIAGQGSSESGYALYIQDGKVFMDVYQHATATSVATSQPLPDKFDLMASLTKGGKITIEVDGKTAAEGNAHMLFMETLPNTLRTGEDGEGDDKIGPYAGRFGFRGNFQKATLELQNPKAMGMEAAETVRTKTSTLKTSSNARVIELKVVPEMLQFDKALLTAKAGEKLAIILENPDGMQHNLLIIKVGSLQKVGAAADKMLSNPKAAEMAYVPEVPDVIEHTGLVNPGETSTLEFTVPSVPGDYPFVCTFPGHWRGMNGILRVTK